MKHIVSVDWLNQQLYYPDVRVIDCRFVLGNPNAGRERYLHEHIPEAFYLDLEKDLSGPIEVHGGRHPLPNLDELVQKLSNLGIDERIKVVAYDEKGGAMAARLWWLLQYLGHQRVYILDGGLAAWKVAGLPVSNEIPRTTPREFKANIQHKMAVEMEEIRNKLADKDTILVDSREEKRYLGLEEPIDRVAGHIPGATNHFWKEGLNSEGNWKTPEEQLLRFQEIDPNKEIIVYCGSGVTACPNFIALKEAGFGNVRLYVGSWSDWITYKDNPIASKRDHN